MRRPLVFLTASAAFGRMAVSNFGDYLVIAIVRAGRSHQLVGFVPSKRESRRSSAGVSRRDRGAS
jgi:hypothetical protein